MVHHGDGHVEDLLHGDMDNQVNMVEDQLVTITLHNLVLDMVVTLKVDTWVVVEEDI